WLKKVESYNKELTLQILIDDSENDLNSDAGHNLNRLNKCSICSVTNGANICECPRELEETVHAHPFISNVHCERLNEGKVSEFTQAVMFDVSIWEVQGSISSNSQFLIINIKI
ncbi:hypothetical protein L9F63_007723, partial [Diploptera punctata]